MGWLLFLVVSFGIATAVAVTETKKVAAAEPQISRASFKIPKDSIRENTGKLHERNGRSSSKHPSTEANYESPVVAQSKKTSQQRFGRSSSAESDSMIPTLRFGRSGYSDNSDSMIPTLRFGRSDSSENSDSMIPALRFGRSDSSENSDSMIPTLRFGRSGSSGNSDSMIPTLRFGRSSSVEDSDSMIPTIRFGRSGSSENSDSMIPTLRFGRSDSVDYSDLMIPTLRFGRSGSSVHSDSMISTLRFGRSSPNDQNGSMIPTLRFGRNSSEDDSDSMIPQIRFGKSIKKNDPKAYMVHIQSTSDDYDDSYDYLFKDDDSDEELKDDLSKSSGGSKESEEPATKRQYNLDENSSIIPYPRPGREKDNLDKSFKKTVLSTFASRSLNHDSNVHDDLNLQDLNTLLNPGGTESNSNDYPFLNVGKRDDFVLPYPRFGRSQEFDFDGTTLPYKADDFFKSTSKTPKYYENQERFVIPYPRPGKRASEKTSGLVSKKPHYFKLKREQEILPVYVLPYPRPGKKNDPDIIKNIRKRNNGIFVIPFPRPGRSNLKSKNTGITGSIGVIDRNFMSNSKPTYKVATKHIPHYVSEEVEYMGVLPYPRPGRSEEKYPDFHVLPFPRPGRSLKLVNTKSGESQENKSPFSKFESFDSLLPYPRPGRSNLDLNEIKNIEKFDSVLPQLRLGRSDSVIPNIRFGRSDSMTPTLRFGRSDSVIPYIRFGRSDSVVPYPRFGRSDFVVPFPRPGR